MDLLKDITDGLRGSDENSKRTGESQAENRRRDREVVGAGEPTGTDGDGTDDPDRDDEHVCSFCQAEFDADRGTCPECEAEIVLRGRK